MATDYRTEEEPLSVTEVVPIQETNCVYDAAGELPGAAEALPLHVRVQLPYAPHCRDRCGCDMRGLQQSDPVVATDAACFDNCSVTNASVHLPDEEPCGIPDDWAVLQNCSMQPQQMDGLLPCGNAVDGLSSSQEQTVAGSAPTISCVKAAHPRSTTSVFCYANGRKFYRPNGVIINKDKNLVLVSDRKLNAVILFDADMHYLDEFKQLYNPAGLATDSKGYFYVADRGYGYIKVLKVEHNRLIYEGKIGKKGEGNGLFKEPLGLIISSAGVMYVADGGNNRIQAFCCRENRYEFSYSFGMSGNGPSQFQNPCSLALSRDEATLFISDNRNHRIQVWNVTSRSHITCIDHKDLWYPSGIYMMDDGILIVCSAQSPDGCLVFFSTTGDYESVDVLRSGNGDFKGPQSIAVASDGKIIVASAEKLVHYYSMA